MLFQVAYNLMYIVIHNLASHAVVTLQRPHSLARRQKLLAQFFVNKAANSTCLMFNRSNFKVCWFSSAVTDGRVLSDVDKYPLLASKGNSTIKMVLVFIASRTVTP